MIAIELRVLFGLSVAGYRRIMLVQILRLELSTLVLLNGSKLNLLKNKFFTHWLSTVSQCLPL